MTSDSKNDIAGQESILEQEPEASALPTPPDANGSSLVDLPLGEALTVQESLSITLARRTQLLIFADTVGSGKTTLITSLFQLFERGPFAGYLFAGSSTLIGFDRRCHLARTTSGAYKADTERTKRGEDRELLHLRLRKEDCDTPPTDVLISDLTGEKYEEAKDSVDDCRRLPLLRRADHFILLIDSSRLAKMDTRQRAKNDAIMLLRSCLTAKQLGEDSCVDVLFSKWDIVDDNNNKTDTEAFVCSIEKEIYSRFDGEFKRLRLAKIAARPQKDNYKLGHGLAALIPSWIEDSLATELYSSRPIFPEIVRREFDRYLERRLIQSVSLRQSRRYEEGP